MQKKVLQYLGGFLVYRKSLVQEISKEFRKSIVTYKIPIKIKLPIKYIKSDSMMLQYKLNVDMDSIIGDSSEKMLTW